MKKFLLLYVVIAMSFPLFGLVWEEDPTITPEERQQRRELNQRIIEKNLLGAGLKGSAYPERMSDHIEGADPRTWGPSKARDQEEARERLEETDGGINQMEDATDQSDVDFDDED